MRERGCAWGAGAVRELLRFEGVKPQSSSSSCSWTPASGSSLGETSRSSGFWRISRANAWQAESCSAACVVWGSR